MMNKKDLIILVVLVVLSAISVLNFKLYGQDFDRPVATELTVSPSYVDISSGGATVTLSTRVSDTSGVSISSNLSAGIISPADNILNNNKYFSGWSLVSGNQFDGVYEATIFISPTSVPSGTYNVSESESYFRDPNNLSANGQPNPLLQIRNANNTIYFENGICKCPGTSVGDTETINGVTYTVVDNSTIQGQINSGNVKLCTTLVTDMSGLFMNNNSFNSDIGFWDTSNVTNMEGMFRGANSFNQYIGDWNVSLVTNMTAMFRESAFNQDIGSWNVSSLVSIDQMFYDTVFNYDIGGWNISNVQDTNSMFQNNSEFNQDISSWDTSLVTDMHDMFLGAASFNQDISSWNTANVTRMDRMFYSANAFNQDISSWNTINVVRMDGMFSQAITFNQDISSWNVSNVTNMAGMFANASNFNQSIGVWDVSSVSNMFEMFEYASSFNQDLSSWCVPNITTEPTNFSTGSGLTSQNKPIWGTCPTCNITSSVTTGTLTQTVTQSTAIVTTTIDFTTTCSGTLGISASGLPPGVLSSISSNSITLYGFPSNQASGTYNYSIQASNTSGTSSVTATGTFMVFDIETANCHQASLSAIQRSVTSVASGTLNICVGEEIIFSAAPVTSGFTYEFTIDGVVVQARSNQSTYTITSLGNNENVRVEVFSGPVTDTTSCSDLSDRFNIQIDPVDSITLISSPTTDNQSVCLFDDDNPDNAIAAPIQPIEYQLTGVALGQLVNVIYRSNGGPVHNGLPQGLGYTITPSNTILISGSVIASTTFTTPTVNYAYEIVTGGACVSSTIAGNITVHSPPLLVLSSTATTTNQTGFLAVCDRQDPIADIVYTFEGGTNNVVFSWTGPTLNGVNAVIPSGTNSLVISGTPSANITATTQYPYQVTTDGSACFPEVVYTGVIEVKPEELLVLASAPATENQTICTGTGTNTLVPIIYNLEQDAVSAVVSFTPALPGIGYTVTISRTQPSPPFLWEI